MKEMPLQASKELRGQELKNQSESIPGTLPAGGMASGWIAVCFFFVFCQGCGSWRLCPISQCRSCDWWLKLFRVRIKRTLPNLYTFKDAGSNVTWGRESWPCFERDQGEIHFKLRAIGSCVLSPSWYSCLHSVSPSISMMWLAVLDGLEKSPY